MSTPDDIKFNYYSIEESKDLDLTIIDPDRNPHGFLIETTKNENEKVYEEARWLDFLVKDLTFRQSISNSMDDKSEYTSKSFKKIKGVGHVNYTTSNNFLHDMYYMRQLSIFGSESTLDELEFHLIENPDITESKSKISLGGYFNDDRKALIFYAQLDICSDLMNTIYHGCDDSDYLLVSLTEPKGVHTEKCHFDSGSTFKFLPSNKDSNGRTIPPELTNIGSGQNGQFEISIIKRSEVAEDLESGSDPDSEVTRISELCDSHSESLREQKRTLLRASEKTESNFTYIFDTLREHSITASKNGESLRGVNTTIDNMAYKKKVDDYEHLRSAFRYKLHAVALWVAIALIVFL